MTLELVLEEEHDLVARAARDFVRERSSLKRVRAGREDGGFSRELWTAMADLGWLGLTVPEDHGGAGLGRVYAMLVAEELGRGLMPEPYLPVLAGIDALLAAGSPAQQAAHLPAIAGGKRLVALAISEAGARFSWERPTTVVDGGRLRGEKTQVAGGASAELFVVTARGADGMEAWLVPASEARVERQHRLDGRDAAIVRLDGAAGERLAGGDAAAIVGVVDRATIALTAEMLGGMEAAFDMTLAYLKTRVQFGVPIGAFQALQHRAARLYCEIELARAAVWSAHVLVDAGADAAAIAHAASVAKAKCSDTYLLVAHEALQMHGGIGMTDAHDIGLYLKRARVAEMTFGDAGYHRERFARLGAF